MQISPHIESAEVLSPQTQVAELPQKTEAGKAEELEGHKSFAEILAGLLLKTGNTEAESVEDVQVDVPLAEMAKALMEGGAEETVPPIAVQGDLRTEKIHTKIFPEKHPPETEGVEGKGDEVLSGLELSEEEQNILLGVELLLNRSAAQDIPADENVEVEHAAAEIAPDDLTTEEWNFLAGLDQAEGGETETEFTAELAVAVEAVKMETAGENPQNEKVSISEKTPVQEKAARFDRDFPAIERGAEFAAAEAAAENKLLEQSALKKAAGGEKEGRGRLEEARSREKRRFASPEPRDSRAGAESALKLESLQFKAGAETGRQAEGGVREITMELHLPNQGQDAARADGAANAAWETKAGQAFEDLLARELHQNFNNDIVRHASMALRDNGEGTIRLALKPETLGNVKIRLEMAENKITGHILVESEEALRAIEREIHSLEQAFKDSGFEAASLEMSLAADGRGAEQFRQEMEASQFLSDTLTASRYDAAIERTETPAVLDIFQRGTAAVNVLA
jgi:flagellar hook-length control protein FliK